MRVTPSRAVYTAGLACIAYLVFRIFYMDKVLKPCDLPHEHLESLVHMVAQIHTLLTSLRLTHAICYESLLGQIRQGGSLPWEEGGSFCLLQAEVERHEEKDLGAAFQGMGLSVAWDSGEGRYLVSRPGEDGVRVKLVVFSGERELQSVLEPTLHRVGWRRKLLPSNCDFSPSLDCFPARLMEAPLPLGNFGVAGQVPVPRERAEMLKYHYPDSWWKDAKPEHC